MANSVEFFFLIFLMLTSYQMAASEDCALAANLGKKRTTPSVLGARRVNTPNRFLSSIYRALKNPSIKYKFGITVPAGAITPKGYTTRNPSRSYPVVTPPTNFFPVGSSPVTITILPWTKMYIDIKDPILFPCDVLYITCMRAHKTGPVCAEAMNLGNRHTFFNYCALEVTNCRKQSYVWTLVYFGHCLVETVHDAHLDFDVEGDNFWEEAAINIPPFNPITGLQDSIFK